MTGLAFKEEDSSVPSSQQQTVVVTSCWTDYLTLFPPGSPSTGPSGLWSGDKAEKRSG